VLVQSSHLFEPLPDNVRSMAFLDRLHFYVPGWEIPKMRTELFSSHYGFVVDYLAEALRELRKLNFTEMVERDFAFGAHLVQRDRKAVQKSFSGLMKLIHPHGEATREEMVELIELALEGRRRVKEQLKKIGSFEFHQTSFSYIDRETGEEKFVGVPEQGGRNLIPSDPPGPGTLYTAGVSDQSVVGLYRVEVSVSAGTGKLKLAGGLSGQREEVRPGPRERRRYFRLPPPGDRPSREPRGGRGRCVGLHRLLLSTPENVRTTRVACLRRHERPGQHQGGEIPGRTVARRDGQRSAARPDTDREQAKLPRGQR
jgi:predicted ATP-dependent Lon-type protease